MEPSYPGSRNIIREALRLGQIPESAYEICLASVRSSTLKQYNSGLKAWWIFCTTSKISLFSPSIPNVLKFLCIHFEKGASYGTLNSYRSAIAQVLGPSIAQDFRVKRFFQGVYQLRPSKPKYTNTWGPSIVLNFVKKLNNDHITLEYLTYKLAILLALTTGQRVQTLSLIDTKNIFQSEKGVEIKITDKIKTSGKNAFQPILTLPFYKEDISVCVATTLICYLGRTKVFRSNDVKYSKLLLTFKKPIHNATAQTISRWIKKLMKESGVDITKFTPHTTRHASTSAAFKKGITFDTIRSAAGWSANSKTFAVFYNRPIKNLSSFAQAVLEYTEFLSIKCIFLIYNIFFIQYRFK
ncbi:uncharacterized protein LOC126742419 [Anthonomus grandis grandis]|uniref:uncharacterized protein LOC126742419 n=1 Tax=Anthonomus grandis grandis TaxID=2921223 RepID=UPI0021657F99|nr:uncharacterized protein LOC126742419 [Anthonomus grandis grandis]